MFNIKKKIQTMFTGGDAVSGKLGIIQKSERDYKRIAKQSQSELILNLVELLPGYVRTEKKMGKILEKNISEICDSILWEFDAKYHLSQDHVLSIAFPNTPLAKAKLVEKTIINTITARQELQSEAQSGAGSGGNIVKEGGVLKKQGHDALREVIEHGLKANPTSDILRMWMERAYQDLSMRQQDVFTEDMLSAAEKIPVMYQPFYDLPNQMIAGAICVEKITDPAKTDAEYIRRDIGLLVNGLLDVMRNIHQKRQVKIQIPIRHHTICEPTAMFLIGLVTQRLKKIMKENVIIEVISLPADGFNEKQKEELAKLSEKIWGLFVRSELMLPINYDLGEDTKIAAYGADLSSISFPDDVLKQQIEMFTKRYLYDGKSSYFFGLKTIGHTRIAAASPANFIAGPVIYFESKRSIPTHKVDLEELYAKV